jgi:hypothetical protein
VVSMSNARKLMSVNRGRLFWYCRYPVPTNEHRKALGTTFFVSTAAYDAPPRPGNSRYSAKVLNDVSRPVSSPKQSRPCPTSSTR